MSLPIQYSGQCHSQAIGGNGLATSVSSKYYFCYLKVGSTSQISEHCKMTTAKPNCIMHRTNTVTPIPFQQQSLDHVTILTAGKLLIFMCTNLELTG